MRIPWTGKLCEAECVHATQLAAMVRARVCWSSIAQFAGWSPNTLKRGLRRVAGLALGVGFSAAAQTTNSPAATNSAPSAPAHAESSSQGFDEPAFHLVTERNIFNANRSGGKVVLPSQRPARIEYFTLVGTMAYEKGVFAFFEGSNSEFTKVMKANGVIAGHKLMDIYASSVKIEADGKEIELPVGSQMRREDEGTWHLAETSRSGGSSDTSSRNGDSSSRDSSSRNSRSGRSGDSSSRSRRDAESSRSRSENPAETSSKSSSNTSTSSADQAEILKRLMERREKESQ